MQIIQPPRREESSECPYLPGRQKRFTSFIAGDVSAAEMSTLLAEGWRKFGVYFFRPDCPDCRRCIPLRIPVADFASSRSQRRLLRQAGDLRVSFGPLRPDEHIYELYREHAGRRFGQVSDLEEFLLTFYLPSCPGLQSEMRMGDDLVGTGFLDLGADCLSSVYFCFDPEISRRRPGILSILREIEHARRLNLSYYYLGYYVPGCPRMAYKDHFRPREHFDWQARNWRRVDAGPGAAYD